MSITSLLVLPPDLHILAASEFAGDPRLEGICAPTDFVVTRPHSRTPSRVVSADLAELLQQFRRPRTIVEAIINLTGRNPEEAETMLELALPAIAPFLKARWLVAADSDEAHSIAQSLSPGDMFDGLAVTACIQVLEDSEVYQARTSAGLAVALKMARPATSDRVAVALAHEADILRSLDLPSIPRVLAQGEVDGQAYLGLSWCAGIPVTQRAAEIRQLSGGADWARLLSLCVTMLSAYADLHERGVLHGDVYPRNILAGLDGRIFILDHGQALRMGDRVERGCGYVPEFCAPEHARELLDSQTHPGPDAAGEQYSLAALCFLLLTGRPYLNFSAIRGDMLAQVVGDPPLRFAEIGLAPQPQIESVLHKALAKRPEERFATVKSFGAALAAAAESVSDPSPAWTLRSSGDRVERLLELLDCDDVAGFPLSPALPSCSLTYGAAGIAYALYRLACRRGDARLLAAADAWAARAASAVNEHHAFTHEVLDLPERLIGSASLYYGRLGVPFVQALIAEAMGDSDGLANAISVFVDIAGPPCDNQDLTLGLAGVLVGCALLVDAIGPVARAADSGHPGLKLTDLARARLALLTPDAMAGPLAGSHYLGVAHGGAGLCHAAILWSEVSGDQLPGRFVAHLGMLADVAEEQGRGLHWPVSKAGHQKTYMESWCHGAPGYALMWTGAYRLLRNDLYLALAERAAWTAWEAAPGLDHLCCGDAGRAYALLGLLRHTGDREWLARAGNLAERALQAWSADAEGRYSLFKGGLGTMLLLEDLQSPERASFPVFERDPHNFV